MFRKLKQKENTLKSEKCETEVNKIQLKREIGLIGAISLIVTTMIGSGIYISPKGILRLSGSVGAGLLIWLGCGILGTFGALTYAEIGTMVPKSGAEYPVLLEAFGPIPAFLFAWTSCTILKPAGISMLTLTFAKYALASAYRSESCEEPSEVAQKLIASAVIVFIVFLNCASVKLSTRFLTIFSFGKILSLTFIIVGGIVMLAQGRTQNFQNAFHGEPPGVRELALAFYQGLWAFDGWNVLNFVVEEMKNPSKNIPLALIFAMIIVTSLYMLTNVAYLTVMSRIELLASPAVAATFGDRVLGSFAWLIPLIICWSVFGAGLGTGFASGRVYFVAARDGKFTEVLAMLHYKRNTPVPAMLVNGLLSLAMVIPNDFDTLLNYFSFATWTIHGSASAALLYLRYKFPNRSRPYKVPIVIPIIVLAAAFWLVLAPIIDKPEIQYLYAILYVLSGLMFYIPFVHFGYKSSRIESICRFLQKLLLVTLPDDDMKK